MPRLLVGSEESSDDGEKVVDGSAKLVRHGDVLSCYGLFGCCLGTAYSNFTYFM